MSELDKLLHGYAPPPVPAGLAQRAAAGAVQHGQVPGRVAPRRRDPRGGWKRPLWIGVASFGLAFTSAVAATVVSGGRIEIPVVQQVVEAIPVLDQATKRNEPEPQLAAEDLPKQDANFPMEPGEATAPAPDEPGYGKARVMQKLAEANQQVEARRAAGLPTPRADRIERQAKAIVERREAAGLPTPTVEEVEAGLALRELRRMRVARNLRTWTITDQQLQRIADRLPPEKRERFLALPPHVQRQLVMRTIERIHASRAMRQAPVEPSEGTPPIETADPAESIAQ